jgi:iron complex outermembrane receptor protein
MKLKHKNPPVFMAVRRLLAVCTLFAALPVLAQSGRTGTIIGRVLNPATHEYIRNAEVRVEGTPLSVYSGDSGYYEIFNVPAGQVTVVATYTGHESATATVNVAPGVRATRDFELAPARQKGEETLQLSAFVVSEEREGQAKAVAEQKQAMNVKTVMSADNFGDMSEGNIGEFLKYMPGITIDYVETDTRAARMGGMDARYGYVTLDGNTQASGSSGSLGEDSRQFEFESVSMNNIESIEVNKTLTPDMWADAPAGTVNLRTRSALDIKRPKYGFSAGVIWNSLENGFKRTPRHDDALHAKTRPRFSFDYTNSFFDHKLGITLNGAFTNIYKEQFRNSYNFDYTSAQARAAGQPRITQINYKDGPKIVEKSAGGVKVDYEPFRGLRMSAGVSYSWFNDFFANRNLNFVTNATNLGAGSSLTRVVANNSNNTNTRLDSSGESTGKLKDNTNLSYALNYKKGPWTADLSLLYSRARESRGGLAYGTMGRTDVRLGKIGWTAERSSVDSPAWTFQQTSGPDWYNYQNWGKDAVQSQNSNEAFGETHEYTGRFDLKRVMSWQIPTSYKLGAAEHVTFRHRKMIDSFTGTYVGTTGSALTSPMPQSKASFLIDTAFGGGIGPLPVPDKEAMYALMRDHPEYFSRTEANQAADLNTILGGYQANQEDVRAAYVMQESRLGKLQFLAGVRFENTRTTSRIPREVPITENPYAIRNSDGTFSANTGSKNYMAYRWSQGTVTSWGEYNDWLPSFAVKYKISRDLNLKLGYNKAIKRPALNRIAGPWNIAIDDDTGDVTVTIPNPKLKPERSQRFSAMLEYYFEPAGTASIHLFQTEIKNAVDSRADGIPAEEAGFGDDPTYSQFFFRTFHQLEEKRTIRGIELSYSQQLTFLPGELLRGLSVFGTYSQYSADPRPRDGKFFPRNATAGVSWKYRKFGMTVNGTWTDETFTGGNTVPSSSVYTPGAPEYLKPRTILFVNLRYKLTKNLSLFASGDRAYDSGKTWFYKADGRIRQMERYGSQWSVGLKGDF